MHTLPCTRTRVQALIPTCRGKVPQEAKKYCKCLSFFIPYSYQFLCPIKVSKQKVKKKKKELTTWSWICLKKHTCENDQELFLTENTKNLTSSTQLQTSWLSAEPKVICSSMSLACNSRGWCLFLYASSIYMIVYD